MHGVDRSDRLGGEGNTTGGEGNTTDAEGNTTRISNLP